MTAGAEGAECSGWDRVADECFCGIPARGWVGGDIDAPAHRCRQCGPEHCEHAAIARRCQFGICLREAELELTVSESTAPLLVCSLHVSPVLGWGVADPVEPRIRYLTSQEPGAAA